MITVNKSKQWVLPLTSFSTSVRHRHKQSCRTWSSLSETFLGEGFGTLMDDIGLTGEHFAMVELIDTGAIDSGVLLT